MITQEDRETIERLHLEFLAAGTKSSYPGYKCDCPAGVSGWKPQGKFRIRGVVTQWQQELWVCSCGDRIYSLTFIQPELLDGLNPLRDPLQNRDGD